VKRRSSARSEQRVGSRVTMWKGEKEGRGCKRKKGKVGPNRSRRGGSGGDQRVPFPNWGEKIIPSKSSEMGTG